MYSRRVESFGSSECSSADTVDCPRAIGHDLGDRLLAFPLDVGPTLRVSQDRIGQVLDVLNAIQISPSSCKYRS
jgi:hypothetical protein